MPEKDTSSQALPVQDKFFATEKLRRSARAGTQLPNPTMAPYGYDPKGHFRHLFPALELPALFPPAALHPDDHATFNSPKLPPHRLYHGDNLYVLRGLPSESVDLIYIDPPFFSNRTYTQIWGDDNEVRSFNDIFQDGMFSYLAWLNARLWEMKRILKPTGSIYVHCDWHASHYIKTELDKIFGYENFVNEVIWHYGARATIGDKRFQRKHDAIYLYAKNPQEYFFENQYNPYPQASLRQYDQVDSEGRYKLCTRRRTDGTKYRAKCYLGKGSPMTDVWNFQIIPPRSAERLGYPTQKPIQLIQRLIEASCPPGGVVADFFMGGGTTAVVAMGQRAYSEPKAKASDADGDEDEQKLVYRTDGSPRTFIGCDVSRVAVSVTASRLIDLGEEISGVTVTSKNEKELGLNIHPVADIKLGYVGSYPQDKFVGISHDEFSKFILTLYDARPFTQKAEWIHGLANNKIIISVGPGDPTERVDLKQVDGAVREAVKQYQKQFGEGEEKLLQVIGWSFDPQCEGWKRKAVEALNKRGVLLQVELVSLGTESFRQKVFRNIGESNIDLKFNRLNELLSFTGAPYGGRITVRKQSGLTVTFELEAARAMGAGGRLINCQWDFSFDGKRFASREYALNREGKSGAFEAVLVAEHTFAQPGTYVVAARIQDNLDGQATVTAKVEVNVRKCIISEAK